MGLQACKRNMSDVLNLELEASYIHRHDDSTEWLRLSGCLFSVNYFWVDDLFFSRFQRDRWAICVEIWWGKAASVGYMVVI